jgi:hypothetical protein
MLFDPVLNSSIFSVEDSEIIRDLSSQPLICAHCYRPIRGKFFQSGKNYYDDFCWQFRFVIDPLYIERASRRKIKNFDEDGNEI